MVLTVEERNGFHHYLFHSCINRCNFLERTAAVAILNTIPGDKQDVFSSVGGGGQGKRWVRERGRREPL